MDGLAWKLEKLDRTLMEVTHSNLNFVFDFHLASLVDAKEKRAIPKVKHTKDITERRARGVAPSQLSLAVLCPTLHY